MAFAHRQTGRRARIEVVIEPAPYQPRKNLKRQKRLQREFAARKGDFNQGGTTGRERMTAYRQMPCSAPIICRQTARVHRPPPPPSVSIVPVRSSTTMSMAGLNDRPAAATASPRPAGHQALTQYTAVIATLRPDGQPTGENKLTIDNRQ
ncbi:MAG: DUF2161 family putative PD-(D/E)XK-type phosphodiesterase [Caldilineaceae bacterium]